MYVAPNASKPSFMPANSQFGGTPPGFSREAETLRAHLERIASRQRRVTAEGSEPNQIAILAEIDRVSAECGQSGWNGEDECRAIQEDSAKSAKNLVAVLDVTRTPLPEVVPEPDGDLALEWHRDASHWLLLSFQSDGRVNYACRTGEADKATGSSRITPTFLRIVEDLLALVYAE